MILNVDYINFNSFFHLYSYVKPIYDFIFGLTFIQFCIKFIAAWNINRGLSSINYLLIYNKLSKSGQPNSVNTYCFIQFLWVGNPEMT